MIEVWNGQLDVMPLARDWAIETGFAGYDLGQAADDLLSMKESPNSEVFVMTVDGDLVGALGVTILNMFFLPDLYAAVRYWYVQKPYRFLAKTLIRAAERWAKEKGCPKLMVCSNRSSVPADDFYKKMGYQEYETVYIGDV